MPIVPLDPSVTCWFAHLPDAVLALVLGKFWLDELPSVRAACHDIASVPLDNFLPDVFQRYTEDCRRGLLDEKYCCKHDWPRWPLQVLPLLVQSVGGLERRYGRNGRTPLCLAVTNGNEAAVGHLLALGANPDQADCYRRTPLWHNSETGSAAVTEILVAAGANVDIADHVGGDTPLNIAVYHRNERIAHALIEAGADVNIRDNEGRGPLWYAMDKDCSEELVAALTDAGGNF